MFTFGGEQWFNLSVLTVLLDMTNFRQVTLPAGYFFTRVRHDYSNWDTALFREFLQNSVDAGATRVDFDFNLDNYTLTVRDNGRGCSQDILENKLLVLGGSHKDAGSVGGFGLAKELLYFSWEAWSIETRHLKVIGSEGAYSFETTSNYTDGFRATIKIPDNFYAELVRGANTYLPKCDTTAEIYLNGIRVFTDIQRSNRAVRNMGWCRIYRNKAVEDSYIHVRVQGVHMFEIWSGHSAEIGQIVVELQGKSVDLMASSRNEFRHYGHRREIQDFLLTLRTNKRVVKEDLEDRIEFHANKTHRNTVTADCGPTQSRYDGAQGGNMEALVSWHGTGPSDTQSYMHSATHSATPTTGHGLPLTTVFQDEGSPKARKARKHLPMQTFPEIVDLFVLHYEGSNRKVLKFINTPTAPRVLRAWNLAVQSVCAIMGVSVDGIGFTFDDTAHAECLRAQNQSAILINPLTVERGPFFANRVLDLAIHEVAHLMAGRGHDEDWAVQTDTIRERCYKKQKTILRGIKAASRS